MRVFAAVDVRDGAAVQLVGGRPEAEAVRLPDPAVVATRWVNAGFRNLHVVDLDAALGSGRNDDAVAAVAHSIAGRALLQVGGGIRDDEAVRRTLALGADRVVVGTRGVEDRPWLESVADSFPGRIVLAADLAEGVVVTRGWARSTDLEARQFLEGLASLPLAGVLVTDVDREGRQGGVDTALFRRLRDATSHSLMAAGGIASVSDLEALAGIGVDGAILGMALYTGRIDPADALALETP
jgi:phosphoribosylformimino-5-aminoimidazole carboxamide ribotide isomerase